MKNVFNNIATFQINIFYKVLFLYTIYLSLVKIQFYNCIDDSKNPVLLFVTIPFVFSLINFTNV